MKLRPLDTTPLRPATGATLALLMLTTISSPSWSAEDSGTASPTADAAVTQAAPDLSGEVARLEGMLAEARRELDARASSRTRIEEELASLRSKNQGLDENLERTRGELEKARTALDTLQAERDQLKNQLATEKERVAGLEKRITSATGELEQLKERNAALENRLKSLETKLSATGAEKEKITSSLQEEQARGNKLTEEVASLTSERDRLLKALSGARADLKNAQQLIDTTTTERDRVQGMLEQYRSTLGETRQKLEKTIAEQKRLTGELQALQEKQRETAMALEQTRASETSLQEQLTSLKTQIPEPLGGQASLDDLKATAGALSRELKELHGKLRRAPGDASLLQRRDELVAQLGRQQMLIAVATGASGTYRLRPEDTLAVVAARFYGNGNRWPRLYEANSHMLDNPDFVIPELTLIVP